MLEYDYVLYGFELQLDFITWIQLHNLSFVHLLVVLSLLTHHDI